MKALAGVLLLLLAGFPNIVLSGKPPKAIKLPAIGYLGRGYDLLYGNPQTLPTKSGVGPDPGYRAPLFQLDTYKNKLNTPDGLYNLPDGVAANMCNACSLETFTKKVNGAKSYNDVLHGFVEFKAGASRPLDKGDFSGSGDYKAVVEKTSEEDKVLVQSHAVCCVYEAQVLTYDHSPLHDHFIAGVATLPPDRNTNEDKEKYWKFIEEFGTHFIDKLLMGGRIGMQSEIGSMSMTEMESTTVDINGAAGAELKKLTVGAKVQLDGEKEKSDTIEEKTEKIEMFNYGGQPAQHQESIEEVLSTWFESAAKKPMPIHYELRLVSDMVSKTYFPDIPRIKRIGQNVERAIFEYCRREFDKGNLAITACDTVLDRPKPAGWEYTGVGGPFNMQPLYNFERLGGECYEPTYVAAGFAFERGGCNQDVGWTTRIVDKEKCSPGNNPDEGMFVKTLCREVNTEGAKPEWRATGVGVPIHHFTDFDRVGGKCEAGEVLSGLRFRRGGCGLTKVWTDKVVDYRSCSRQPGMQEGIVMQTRCTKIKGGTKNGFWFTSGVGAPIRSSGDFDRVGAVCPDGQYVNGIRFRNGGCGLDTQWYERKHNNAVCDAEHYRNGGLSMDVFCVTPNVKFIPKPVEKKVADTKGNDKKKGKKGKKATLWSTAVNATYSEGFV